MLLVVALRQSVKQVKVRQPVWRRQLVLVVLGLRGLPVGLEPLRPRGLLPSVQMSLPFVQVRLKVQLQLQGVRQRWRLGGVSLA